MNQLSTRHVRVLTHDFLTLDKRRQSRYISSRQARVLIGRGKSDCVTSTLDSADDTFGVELGLDPRKFLGPSNPKNV
ncbi:hypothetical protein SBA2_100057 [Acidobacteriia bacterium SbA2]|nr:hypothetical protein SBA2_100057 [Acidobacteriia bacterium SbA2]